MTARSGHGSQVRLPADPVLRELVLLTLATAAAAIVVGLGIAGLSLGVVRGIAGAFLVGVAPGAALFAVARPRFLATTARMVLAVPVSLSIVALAGVVLDRTPIGIRPEALAVAAAVIAAVLLGAGLWRWGRVDGPGRSGRPSSPPPSAMLTTPAARARDGTPVRLVDRVGIVIAHVKDPLFRNAYALGLSGVITSGLGVVYWAVAARLYPADIVGVNAALLSLVALLANVSQLNLRSGFGRFVPVAGTRTRALVHAGYLAALAIAAVTGLGTIGLLALAPDLFAELELTPALAWLFPATVILWTVFVIQDHVLVAFRRTAVVPVENGLFAVAKIVLLVPLAGLAASYGILVSWLLPTAVGVAIVTGWILARLVPRAQRAAERAAARGETGEDVNAREVVRYVGGDYVGSLFAIGSASILPVIVLATLGATASAHYYVVSMIAMATQLVPTVLATSLLVEVASAKATFVDDGGRILRQLAVLLGPIVIGLVVLADPILSIFGPTYAADGVTALRLLALAGIPYSLITLAFIRLRLEGRVRSIVAAQAVLAVLLIVPALIVMPTWGIVGIGAVTLVSQSVVAAVLSWIELRPLFRGLLRPGLEVADHRAGPAG